MEALIANVTDFIDQHPALMAAVVWPVLSALLLLAEHWLEAAVKRPGLAPVVGVLRAVGFDPIGLLRAVRAALSRARGGGPGAPGSGDAAAPTPTPIAPLAAPPPKAPRVLHLSSLLWLTALMTVLGGCAGARPAEAQTRVVATVETAINSVALPALRDEYTRQGRAELAAAREHGETAVEARARLDALDARWRPVVEAFATLRLANDAYIAADALAKSDGDTARVLLALGGLRRAWCDFRAALPPGVELPDLLPCSGEVSR